ncbi:xanthine dehydrogenase family protein subunit M [Neorhizobium sp. NCHU2750]|uniref:FAD binding domain-containing protein n=1 Tax=Neorhizobium sp. NCHU2750 TaxID=1825976 RepID=UPI000E72E0CE|nr:xanthine dehydrogenase FAD-binding subunit [Neorhizobium sp. NCHU2750]
MRDFSYLRAASADEARQASRQAGAMLLAGGTTLLDLAKCGVAEPDQVIDISHLSDLDRVVVDESGATIGALAKMSAVADDPAVIAAFPAIAQSLSLAASQQLRNMATIGGNLLQRTRCPYFRDPATFAACNKRNPGSGCSAIGGVTRNHAVLGASEQCIATYPGDLAVALVAFDAAVELRSDQGTRSMPVEDFFVEPGERPDRETVIQPGEMITGLAIPTSAAARNSTYLKIRDRQSYEFAAASAAVGLDFEADGRTVKDVRVALGGVATRPWRVRAVEAALTGKALTEDVIAAAVGHAIDGAVAQGGNHYKIELAPRVVARALKSLGGLA